MKKTIQISIPTPCHEGWENMTPANKGRFCSSCQKTVIDFTHLPDREIATSIKNDKNLCGRFLNSQLQRDLIIPKEKNSLWVAASAAVVSFLTIGNNTVIAQAPVNTEQTENKTDDIKNASAVQPSKNIITGIVYDETGLPLPGTNVTLKGTEIGVQTDIEGKFTLEAKLNTTIEFSFIGYENEHITVTQLRNYEIHMENSPMIGEIVVVEYQRTFFGRIFHSIGDWFR